MVKHIVMFKLTPFESTAAKMERMNQIKNELEALKGLIPNVEELKVGLNSNPNETWDIVLESAFPTWEDLNNYAVHPLHVACAKNLIGPVKADRACVDYEF